MVQNFEHGGILFGRDTLATNHAMSVLWFLLGRCVLCRTLWKCCEAHVLCKRIVIVLRRIWVALLLGAHELVRSLSLRVVLLITILSLVHALPVIFNIIITTASFRSLQPCSFGQLSLPQSDPSTAPRSTFRVWAAVAE